MKDIRNLKSFFFKEDESRTFKMQMRKRERFRETPTERQTRETHTQKMRICGERRNRIRRKLNANDTKRVRETDGEIERDVYTENKKKWGKKEENYERERGAHKRQNEAPCCLS